MTKSVVMIHGAFAGPWCWDNYRAFFAMHGWTCHTPTLRYHGGDPKANPDPDLAKKRDNHGQVSSISKVELETRAFPLGERLRRWVETDSAIDRPQAQRTARIHGEQERLRDVLYAHQCTAL